MSRFSLTLLLVLCAVGFAMAILTGMSGQSHRSSIADAKAAAALNN